MERKLKNARLACEYFCKDGGIIYMPDNGNKQVIDTEEALIKYLTPFVGHKNAKDILLNAKKEFMKD